MTGARAASASQDKEVSGRGAPGGGGSPRTGPSRPAIRLEKTRPRRQRPQAAGRRGNLVGRNGWALPFHPEGVETTRTTRGRASRRARTLTDSPGGRPSGSAWVAPPTGATNRLVLYRDATSSPGSVQSSDSNELPARQPAHFKARRKSGRGSNQREQVPCP